MAIKEKLEFSSNNHGVQGFVTLQLFEGDKLIKEVKQHNTASAITRAISGFISAIQNSGSMYLGTRNVYLHNSSGLTTGATILLECLSTLESSVVDNKVFAPYTRLGYALADSTYAGSSVMRGSFNASESGVFYVDGSHIKFHIVVDFSTNAANGTFNSIQLSPYTFGSGTGEVQTILELAQSGLFNTPYPENQGYGDMITPVYYNPIPYATITDSFNQYFKFMSQDQTAMWWFLMYKGQLVKLSFDGQNSLLESHLIHWSDGTTLFTSAQPVLDMGTYLLGWFWRSSYSAYKIFKVDKSTWNVDAAYNSNWNNISWTTSVPASRFVINGLAWNNEATGACSSSGEIYWYGYTQETINSITTYHYYLYVLDSSLNILHLVFLGSTTSRQTSNGVVGLKDYILILDLSKPSIFQYRGHGGMLIRRSDYSRVGACLFSSNNNLQYFTTQYAMTESTYSTSYGALLSHNIDNNLRVVICDNIPPQSTSPAQYSYGILFPYTYLNKVILSSPVTKTSLNTMKIQYDLTVEIPNPTITV